MSMSMIYEGPTSLVQKSFLDQKSVAIKTSSIHLKYAKEPHDIVKEVRLIASISHPNVISILHSSIDSSLQNMSFWMPYIPRSLFELLSLTEFSPHPLISIFPNQDQNQNQQNPREQRFTLLAKSLMYQILTGVAFLHETAKIAHRDLKPSNVLLDLSGRVKIIDFGTAWKGEFGVGGGGDEGKDGGDSLWEETSEKMYFEVSTGPYRAPELLFGPRKYDAFAIDSWSLGAMFAEFFTSVRLSNPFEVDHEREEEERLGKRTPAKPFIIPKKLAIGDPSNRWGRDSLFDFERGELGLVWSICTVRGSPNEVNWPSFHSLPDANKVSFVEVQPVDLCSVLPNLPFSSIPQSNVVDTKTHLPSETMYPTPVDLVHRFLVYEPSRRISPFKALNHPWFITAPSESESESGSEPPLILPDDGEGFGFSAAAAVPSTQSITPEIGIGGAPQTLMPCREWGGKTLGEWLLDVHPRWRD